MAENERPGLDDGETKRGFASAFVNRTGGRSESDRRLGPRIWAVGIAVVLVAAVAVAIGFITRPHPAAAAVAKPTGHASTTPAPGPTTTTVNLPTVPAANPYATIPGSGGGALPAQPAYPVGPYQVPAAGAPAMAPPPAMPDYAAPPPAVAPQAQQQPAAQPATYSATTGYGCAQSASMVFTQTGFYSDGNKGWIRLGQGGLNQAGCNNTFDGMPMSGSATQDDNTNFVTWQFRTGAVQAGLCHVSIYIPDVANIVDVGGHPSTYLIYNSFTATGTAPWAVQVDQTANRGKWVTSQVNITSGAVTVKLLSRGIDYNQSTGRPDFAHHAVSAVHIDCVA